MIKTDLFVCAVISRAATVKKHRDGSDFLSFDVKLPVTGRNGEQKDLEINVAVSGSKGQASVFALGRRVNLMGVMTVRRYNDKTYFNLLADTAELANSKEDDRIEGTIDFMGKISKKGIEERTDKKGNAYKTFAGFSANHNNDKVEFVWVSFLYFNPKEGEDFLQPNSYVEVKGDLKLGVFRDAISIDCLVNEVAPWEPQKKQ